MTALNSVGSSRARVDIVRNRLGEIRGPLSGRDVTALLEPIGSSNGRMEVFRLLAKGALHGSRRRICTNLVSAGGSPRSRSI